MPDEREPTLGLSWLDELAAGAMAPDGEAKHVVRLTAELARALAGHDAPAVRARTLARLTAIEKHTLQILQVHLGEAVARGRLGDAERLDRLASRSLGRLRSLLSTSEGLEGSRLSVFAVVAKSVR